MSVAGGVPRALSEQFVDFFKTYYEEDIARLATQIPDTESLWIDAADLYAYEPDLLNNWITAPDDLQAAAEAAVPEVDIPVDADLSTVTVCLTDEDAYIARQGVADLTSDDLGDYVAVTGLLDRVTGVGYRLATAAYQCQRCQSVTEIPQPRMGTQEPHECSGCQRQGPFALDTEASEFVDQRKIKVAEPPGERNTSEGQSIPAYAEHDLCDVGGENGLPDRAGEQAVVFGKLRIDESELASQSNDSPEVDEWLDVRAIHFESSDFDDIDIKEHREEFEALAAREDAIDLCKQSIAPAIKADEQLETVIEAATAWLFNSYRINPENQSAFRGDLHCGIIGDPGLGKSTINANLHRICPRSEYRSGTNISGVGLTAAATQDDTFGASEWTLEPGILPRANGGHAIVDEIDAVLDDDTKKMHDALEGEQVVKVDKAGISADLPTRTALLCTGNPTYGRFDQHEPIGEQIDLDDALIDRLDVLLTLEDEQDTEQDREKASHILDAVGDSARAEVASRDPGADVKPPDDPTADRPVSLPVFRAWVAYARENVFPVLTEAAKRRLENYYVEVRSLNGDNDDAPIPATARTLEAGIRLSIAFARVELSDRVEERHADRAIGLSREVVGLNYDPDTHQFDDRRTGRGSTKSQRDRMKSVRSVIEDVQSEHNEGAPVDVVLECAEEQGIDRGKAEHEIEKLKENGELYNPGPDHLRTT